MTIRDEFSFINQIKPKTSFQHNLITGIGDDAAIIQQQPEMEQIICMDTMVESVHFTSQTMSPFQIGYKALAVNISDIAAMGGIPTFYLVSIAIPAHWPERDLLSIYEGMAKIANKYHMDLIGGDTVSTSHALTITVTVLGEIENGKHLLRSHAKDGDLVFVTGTLGDSAAGLDLLLHKGKDYQYKEFEQYLVKRHQYPEPRVEVGRILSNLTMASLNDVSDGIASEANEIAEASQVMITIDRDSVPISQQLKQYDEQRSIDLALYGGEDYELIGTMPEANWKTIKKQCEQVGISITKIGTVSKGKPSVLLNNKGTISNIERKGYNHFNF